jgi:hypothetical protein
MLGTGRNLGGCTIVNFGLDGWSRGRKALTQYEEAQLLRILHNRWLQWRFVNARAEAVISAQKTSAEVCTILEQGSCFSIGTTLHCTLNLQHLFFLLTCPSPIYVSHTSSLVVNLLL